MAQHDNTITGSPSKKFYVIHRSFQRTSSAELQPQDIESVPKKSGYLKDRKKGNRIQYGVRKKYLNNPLQKPVLQRKFLYIHCDTHLQHIYWSRVQTYGLFKNCSVIAV